MARLVGLGGVLLVLLGCEGDLNQGRCTGWCDAYGYKRGFYALPAEGSYDYTKCWCGVQVMTPEQAAEQAAVLLKRQLEEGEAPEGVSAPEVLPAEAPITGTPVPPVAGRSPEGEAPRVGP